MNNKQIETERFQNLHTQKNWLNILCQNMFYARRIR